MNRRDFTTLLPAAMLSAAALLPEAAKAQSPKSYPPLKSGGFPPGPKYVQQSGRDSRRFFAGMLPDNIRSECHMTTIEPGTPHEPVNKHLHSEVWYCVEGTVSLNINGVEHTLNAGDVGLCAAGDLHYVTNIGKTRATYFVITVGPPEPPAA
ncbi:MAG: cupin domain-containing protein [Acidobacteriaceae bacterium]|nr:cupin domain-containing protein [Acidobacteriaceae bacterium]